MYLPSRRLVRSSSPLAPAYSEAYAFSPPRASYPPVFSQGHGSQQGHHYINRRLNPGQAYSRDSGPVQNYHGNRPLSGQSNSVPREGINSENHGHNLGGQQTHRRTSGRAAVAQGVASGQIGSAYGPYAFDPQGGNVGVFGGSRFNGPPTDRSSSTPEMFVPFVARPPETSTLPHYLVDKEVDFDDAMHVPDPRHDDHCTPFSWRGWINVSTLVFVTAALLMLFLGYPVLFFEKKRYSVIKGFNLGGINGSGQIPDFPHLPRLIDPDTPREAYGRTGNDGHKYNLVFSDEFNRDGRSFYPGDDPFWEAVDMHYWATGDWEWYDPSTVTTKNGSLVITMEENYNHELNFMSGMIQSWNKLCFTTGYIEVAISLPLSSRQVGLWPGAWTMGNLGRAGYGASTEGTWPYTYDSCDLGTFPSQEAHDGSPGPDALNYIGKPLSSLPGQKLSACSCPDSDHPGPRPNVGRGAPEVDIIEGGIDQTRWIGGASQTFQVAPFNYQYSADRTESATSIYNASVTRFNSYKGGPYQQAISALTDIDPQYYGGREFTTFAYELWSNPNARGEGFITWYNQGIPSWTVTSATVGPDARVNISQRLIPEEPMYVILNLGMAFNFQQPDFKHLTFPAKMYVDYVRVFQREGVRNGVTCDPPSRPTAKYIENHLPAYMNRDLIKWSDANFTFPRNSLYDGC